MAETRTTDLPGPDATRIHDSAAKWTPSPDWSQAAIDRNGWSARPVPALSQVLISGDVATALAAHAPQAAEVGMWGMAASDPIAVRIARDRCLLVSSDSLDMPFGWRDGWAASPAGSAWFAAELAGSALAAVMREGTAVNLDGGSRSASLLFAGVPALLYRTAEDRARLHVETGFGPYLWRWLEARRD
jgi:hypothetical protein